MSEDRPTSEEVRDLRQRHTPTRSPPSSPSSPSKRAKASCGINLHGVHVSYVIPGGPAQNRIKKGDIITTIDGQAATASNVVSLLRGHDEAGSNVEIQVQGLQMPVVLQRADAQQVERLVGVFHALSECQEEARKIKQERLLGKLITSVETASVRLVEW